MLNLRMLFILLDQHSVRTYLAIVTSLGFGVLLDLLIFLHISVLIGPWITLAVLAVITGIGVVVMFPFVDRISRLVATSIDRGKFDSGMLSNYLGVLIAAGFIIVPGLFNSLVGGLLLIRPLSIKVGDAILRMTGIDWQEAYEYLRLDHIARDGRQDSAQS